MYFSNTLMMPSPLISIVMPAYNHERFVGEAIKSVWSQTYKNIELIVIDDGSTDRTGAAISELVACSPISTKFIQKKNEGVCRTLDHALTICRGDFIGLLASDDFYAEDFIEKMHSLLSSSGDRYGCAHCDAFNIDENGVVLGRNFEGIGLKPILENDFLSFAYGNSRIVAGSVLFRRKVFDTVGFFDESLKAEDFDFHLRVLRKWSYVFLDRPLYFSRKLNRSLGRTPAAWINDGVIALAKHAEFLGDSYNDVIRVKELRNYRVCLF